MGDWRTGHGEIEGWGNPGEPGDENAVAEEQCEEQELHVADDEFGELVDRFD